MATEEAAAQVCVGDCNGNRAVSISELVTGVNIALNAQSVDVCPAVDRNNSRTVSVDELVVAVNNALRGCPMVSPTTSATPTVSATATNTIPIFTPTTSTTATASPTPTNTVPTATATLTATATPTPEPPTLHAEINPDRVAPGESVVISITVTNPGMTDLTGVIVRASLPAAGIAGIDRFFISDGGACNNFSCSPGQQASWNIGTLAARTGKTVSFPMSVLTGQSAPSDGTALTTQASVVANGIGQIIADATVVVDSNRALAVAIDEDQDPVAPSAELHYAVRYGNRGLTPLNAATLEVPLPVGTNFISATDGGTLANGTVTWPLGDLAAGANGVREMVVEVDTNSGGAIAAEATLTSGIEEAVAQTVARVEAVPALTVSLVAGPEPVSPGEPLAVALTVTNRGATDLFGVSAELRVPAEVLPFAPADADGPVCNRGASNSCDNLERAIWTIGDLAAGHGVTLNIPPIVLSGQSAPRSGTLISFDVEVLATDVTQLKLRRNVIVEANRKLDLEIDAGPQPVAHGALLTYTLSFGNRSVGQLAAAQLTMPVPVGTAFLSASDGGMVANDVVTWPLGDLAAGASGVRELVVVVDDMADEGQPVVADATLAAGDAEARAQVVTRVQTNTDLTVEIDVGPDPVMPGEPLEGSLTVSNRGPVTLFDVQAEVRVPAELAGFAPDHTNGVVSCRSGVSFACDPLERALWTVGDLAPGQGSTLTFPALVLSGQTGPPSGTVIVFDGRASANDGSIAQSRRSITVRPNRPLELELAASPQTVGLGEELHYALTYGNRSAGMLAGASLELPLPPGTTVLSADGGNVENNKVVWPVGDLAPGQVGFKQPVMVVEQANLQGQPLPARATLKAGGSAAHAEAMARVQDDVPLTLNLTLTPDPVIPGQPMQLLATVTNRGLVSLFDVAAAIRVPQEVAIWSPDFTTAGGMCRAGASFACDNLEREIFTLGELVPGQSVTLSVPPIVLTGQTAPPPGAVIAFEADASANDGSFVLARRNVAVQAARPLELEIDAIPQPADAGDPLHYVLSYGNRGASTLSGGTLSIPLPPGTTLQSAPGAIVLDDLVSWPLGDLAAGASGEHELFVVPDAGAIQGQPLLAQALLSAGGVDERAETVTNVFDASTLGLVTVLGPNPVSPGQMLQLSVTVMNQAPVSLFGLSAFVRVPPEVSAFGTAATTGGAICNKGVSFACDNLEPVRFASLATPGQPLGAGQGVTFTIAAPVPMGAAAPPPGTIISFEVDVVADDGSEVLARPNVRVQ